MTDKLSEERAAFEAWGLTDDEIDRLWICRKNIHSGELMPQLRDLARAVIAAQRAKEGER